MLAALATQACFNLVIERLLISGSMHRSLPNRAFRVSFNLVIERLLISGLRDRGDTECLGVSISLSSGFSFQVHRRIYAAHRRNARVSISLSSGFSFQATFIAKQRNLLSGVSISLSSGFSFQSLRTAQRLRAVGVVSISLSSGFSFQIRPHANSAPYCNVSISLSSGFSFQVKRRQYELSRLTCFHLVIERLLISGV